LSEDNVIQEICELRMQVQATEIRACEGRISGIEGCIQEVRDLQTKILYAIIGIFGTLIVTLIGVVMGRAIDFGILFT
jgi:hypothetical protein